MTSNKSECLLKKFERGKIWIVNFKERNTKNEYIKHIYNPVERENWKSLKDTVKKIVKIKIQQK